ncbi:MAG: zinc-ribbon domain-containing protein [Deltaproteobacteria bacterium]|nr:zinc-ribbon domain-containing protein [Deltaproteobacteria bacterium]
MDVRCERCNSEYEFEDARVPDTGLSVKCSTCGNVFRVFRAGSAFGPAATGVAQDWTIRQVNGNVFTFRELTTLQRWIVERKVSRDDVISKTGKQWKRLGDIAELATFFQVVEAQPLPQAPIPGAVPQVAPHPAVAHPGMVPGGVAPAMAQQGMPQPGLYPAAPPMPQQGIPASIFPPGYPPQPLPGQQTPVAWPPGVVQNGAPMAPQPMRHPTGPQAPMAYPPAAQPGASYPIQGAAWEQSPQPLAFNQPSGAWQMGQAPTPTTDPNMRAPFADDELAIKRGGKGWLVFLLVVLILGGGAGAAYYLKPAWFRALLGQGNELALTHVKTGYKELDKDSYAAIDRAIENFNKAISIDASLAGAAAGLAEAELARAEYLAEEADDLTNARKGAPDAEVGNLTTQIETRRREASEHSEKAFNAAKSALALEPTAAAGLRAMADYYRFKKATDQMRPLLDQAKAAAPVDARLSYVLGSSLLLEAAAADRAIAHFNAALELDPTLERARYKLARAYVTQGDKDKALRQLEALLKDVPDHERALALQKELTPAPVTAPLTPEPPPPPAEPDKKKPSFDQLLAQADRLRETDRAAKAIKLYEKALDVEPDDPDAMTGMGWCYVDMEQPDAAVATFKQVLANAPKLSDAHMGIAEAYRLKGSRRDAIKHFQEYLNIMPNGPDAEVARRALKDLGQ